MKKKLLLLDWEIIQQEYYEQFNRSQIAKLWEEWFDKETPKPYTDKYDLIDQLIQDELIHRKNDTIKELEDTIRHIAKLSAIKARGNAKKENYKLMLDNTKSYLQKLNETSKENLDDYIENCPDSTGFESISDYENSFYSSMDRYEVHVWDLAIYNMTNDILNKLKDNE